MKNNKIIKFVAEFQRQVFPSDINTETNYRICAMDINEKRTEQEEIKKIKFNTYGNVTIVGDIPSLNYDTDYIIEAEEQQCKNPKYGYQYLVKKIRVEKPTTKTQAIKFLSEIISNNDAKVLLSAYPNIIDKVIKNDLDDIDLSKTKGIKEKKFQKIKDKIIENFCLLELMDEYVDDNNEPLISFNVIKKLYDKYTSVDKIKYYIKTEPYNCLCSLNGIAFEKADKIVLKLYPEMKDSPKRVKAYVEFLLKKNEENGNTWMYTKDLVKSVKEKMNSINYLSDIFKDENFVHLSDDKLKISHTFTYKTESYICDALLNILNNSEVWDIDYEKYFSIGMIPLTKEQQKVPENLCKYNISLLAGFAGSGKSFSIQAVIRMLEDYNKRYLLLAPTGRASEVIADYTNRPASTIHRGLAYNPMNENPWTYNKDNKLPFDVVIVDESSMIDIFLMKHLLEAIDEENTKLLFIQDPEQIASVSAGNCSKDMIMSNIIPKTILTQIFRYGDGGLMQIATKVRNGEKFIDKSINGVKQFGINKDYTLVDIKRENMLPYLKKVYSKLIQKGNTIDDITIMSPFNKGEYGCRNINKLIQDLVNPDSPNKKYIKRGENIFRVGDKVMQVQNNYHAINIDDEETFIFNGNLGVIIDIDIYSKIVYVQYKDSKTIKYTQSILDQIELAYAMTIHKCITDDTWIYTNKGIMQLKQLNNDAKVGEFKPIKDDILVFNGLNMEKPKSFYNNGIDECKLLITKRKYRLEGTLNHGVDILCEDGYIRRRNMKDIKEGDFVLINKNNNIYGSDINIPKEWQNIKNVDTRTIKYKLPHVMTLDFARFLGYMVADGTVCDAGIKLGKRHKEVTEDFIRVVENIFGYCGYMKHVYPPKSKNGMYLTEINSKYIRDFCLKIDGIKPHNKYIPQIILNSPKKYQKEFLKCLFEDGTVNLKNSRFDHIELCFKDEFICEQVRMMLLNMGIVTTLYKGINKKNNKTFYRIYIYKKEALIYKKEIGFISNFKNNRLELLNGDNINSNITIPYITNIIKGLKNNYNLNLNKADREVTKSIRKNKITYEVLNKFLISTEDTLKNDKDYKYLLHIYNNLYVDKITQITKTKKPTYCLEMPLTHKFLQNGINAWNCQGGNSPIIIIITDVSHKYFMNRNLLYTALTRMKKTCIHLSNIDTINSAIKKSETQLRNSYLCDMLKEKYANN